MTKKITLTIVSRYWGEVSYEDLPSEELGNGLAVAHSSLWKWAVFDVKSGLLVASGCRTKYLALEKYQTLIKDKEKMANLEKSRKSLTYKDRCLDLERHRMYR